VENKQPRRVCENLVLLWQEMLLEGGVNYDDYAIYEDEGEDSALAEPGQMVCMNCRVIREENAVRFSE
jgi:hypothetical protein